MMVEKVVDVETSEAEKDLRSDGWTDGLKRELDRKSSMLIIIR